MYMYSVLPRGGAWVESDTISKLLALPHFHNKEKSSLKACLFTGTIFPKYAGENTDEVMKGGKEQRREG